MGEKTYRACHLCEATCGVVVETEAGRVVSIRGDEDDPFSRGFICPKAYALKELADDPDRIREPLRRTADGWQPISWEDAYAEAAANLLRIRERYGAGAIATYIGNPTAHSMGSLVYLRVLLRALGTRSRYSATSVDQLPKMFSSSLMFGDPLSIPVPDVDRTDYFLVLGANPMVSNGSLMTAPGMPKRLRRLRERGGKLVVVDPRRTETARVADEHLAIRPGSDAFLLFSIVHTLFAEDLAEPGRLTDHLAGIEEIRELAADFAPEAVAPLTGIAAADVRRITREFAAARSAVCYGRIGTCTQEFGALASWLVDVVNALTGNLDRPGGAMFTTPAASFKVGAAPKAASAPYARWKSRVRGLPEFAGELPVATLAEDIDTPGPGQIRALVTLAGNPVLSTPDGARLARALDGLDYMVSIDVYVNETTRHANLILPASWALSDANYDLALYQFAVRNVAKLSPPALPAEPGTRPDWRILLELSGHMMGLPGGDLAALDEVVLGDVLPKTIGRPGTRAAGATVEAARAALGDEPGPERILDLLLRAGAYGDGFDDRAEGLSLQKLRAAEHGIDLGPLEPRLPGILATPSRKVELAPAVLAGDVARLRRAARRKPNGIVLIGRRQLRSNNSWMHNSPALVKGPERCRLLVHPADASRLGLADEARARITSRAGSVEAMVSVTDEMMPGVVSLPHGWGHDLEGVRLSVARAHAGVPSNFLADPALVDELSGNAVLNGIPVEVSPA